MIISSDKNNLQILRVYEDPFIIRYILYGVVLICLYNLVVEPVIRPPDREYIIGSLVALPLSVAGIVFLGSKREFRLEKDLNRLSWEIKGLFRTERGEVPLDTVTSVNIEGSRDSLLGDIEENDILSEAKKKVRHEMRESENSFRLIFVTKEGDIPFSRHYSGGSYETYKAYKEKIESFLDLGT